MKVSPDIQPAGPGPAPVGPFRLPQGLIGFAEYRSFTLLADPEQAPFIWMRLEGAEPIDFVVIEPGGIIPNYEMELFDEDASFVGIRSPADAYIFNIVTVRPGVNATATVNLTAPVVVNRHTGLAKQCILANHTRFSAYHPLVENDNSADGGQR
ncbi:flagellar assembly protein FliW [Nibricoccus sp. IMCC34717]|uniref:flagellar assembly protein FliW n=1 Tax=Nibricoccus sp. IMCC34717 TaxID=3034021 RepID=UPI00384CA074